MIAKSARPRLGGPSARAASAAISTCPGWCGRWR